MPRKVPNAALAPKKHRKFDGHALFVRVPKRIDDRLAELIKTYGMKWSEIIRRIIEDALDAGWNPADSMKKRASKPAKRRTVNSSHSSSGTASAGSATSATCATT